jgi:putative acetyltransferase
MVIDHEQRGEGALRIRSYESNDLDDLVRIFTRSVHELGRAHYQPAQLDAWAPRPPDSGYWRHRLAGLSVRVAEDMGWPVGFIGWSDGGHVDLLFTEPGHARQGVASRLYREVEARLLQQGVKRLSTEASRMARPFFERMGFQVLERESAMIRGVEIERFRMQKTL